MIDLPLSANSVELVINAATLNQGFRKPTPLVNFAVIPKPGLNHSEPTFGTPLGFTAEGVAAFSNGSSSPSTSECCRLGDVVTGLSWQCVEFARRWLLQTRNLIFADVHLAAHMWNEVNYLTHVVDKQLVPMESHLNGSMSKPRIGDLLIYSEAFLGTGHVALVVGADNQKGTICIAEQNYSNRPWAGDHSRQVQLEDMDDHWWILDSHLIGWKRTQ